MHFSHVMTSYKREHDQGMWGTTRPAAPSKMDMYVCNARIFTICIPGQNSMKFTGIPSWKENCFPIYWEMRCLIDTHSVCYSTGRISVILMKRKPQPSDGKEKFSEIQALRSKYENHEAHWCVYVYTACLLDKRSASLDLVPWCSALKLENSTKCSTSSPTDSEVWSTVTCERRQVP